MAQPDAAQPDAAREAPEGLPEMFPPDQFVPSVFEARVIPGPQGGRFMAVTLPNQRRTMVLNFSDDADAERVANELKPSRVARANGKVPGKSGLVVP